MAELEKTNVDIELPIKCSTTNRMGTWVGTVWEHFCNVISFITTPFVKAIGWVYHNVFFRMMRFVDKSKRVILFGLFLSMCFRLLIIAPESEIPIGNYIIGGFGSAFFLMGVIIASLDMFNVDLDIHCKRGK
jgi:hypothetical protein